MKTFSLTIIAALMTSPVFAGLGRDAAVVKTAFVKNVGYADSAHGGFNRGDGFDRWLQNSIIGPGAVFRIEDLQMDDETLVDADVPWGRGRATRYIFNLEGGQIDSWQMTRR